MMNEGRKKAYDKTYYREHKEERDKRSMDYYWNNRDRILKYKKQTDKKTREQALTLLGGSCSVCSRKKNLNFHMKDGSPHSYSGSVARLVLKSPERFVLLCRICHTGVEFCLKFLGFPWESVKSLVKEGVSW